MTDKEKAYCFIELYKEQMNHFKQTRDIEFKVNIAFWTLIVLAGYFLNLIISSRSYSNFNCFYIIIALLFLACHLFLWLLPISRSEKIDLHYIKEYRDKIEDLAGEKPTPYYGETKDGQERRIMSWMICEATITCLLLIVLGILMLQ